MVQDGGAGEGGCIRRACGGVICLSHPLGGIAGARLPLEQVGELVLERLRRDGQQRERGEQPRLPAWERGRVRRRWAGPHVHGVKPATTLPS